ncbi:hypothetical protein LXA43DRAFT_239219 [Ganoderma leucocontextum]|nr:hypothetical protein LXA43DRAFT_239219 [Ganoderma leucocontextum]
MLPMSGKGSERSPSESHLPLDRTDEEFCPRILHRMTILPRLRSFLAIRLNPVAMVQQLPFVDLEALAAAEAMELHCQKYLVFITNSIGLPMPPCHWGTYTGVPVATTLRPACPELGITPDTVLPIPPNDVTAGLSWPTVDSDPPQESFQLPFGNCYFWACSSMNLRIHARYSDLFDDCNVVRIPMSLMQPLWKLDAAPSRPTPLISCARLASPYIPPNPAFYVSESCWRTAPPSAMAGSSTQHNLPSPIINPDDPYFAFLPLFDAWYELEDHLNEDTIGSSRTTLWQEQHTISK